MAGGASSSEWIGDEAEGGEAVGASCRCAKVERSSRTELAGGSGGGTSTVVIIAGRANEAGGEGMFGGANGGTESAEADEAKSER